MKKCTYCGRDNDGLHQVCRECGTPLSLPEGQESPVSLSSPPSKVLVGLRRVLSAILGFLVFAVGAPEFGWIPRLGIFFYVVAPLVPVVCVWYGAGSRPAVEATGWGLLLVDGLLIFSS